MKGMCRASPGRVPQNSGLTTLLPPASSLTPMPTQTLTCSRQSSHLRPPPPFACPQYYVHAISEDWLHAEELLPLSFANLILPERMPPNTGAGEWCFGAQHPCGR